MNEEKISRWQETAKNALVGRTILAAHYMDKSETHYMGWDQSGIFLVLDNGAQVIVQRDEEGNGPGVLCVVSEQDSILLPTL